MLAAAGGEEHGVPGRGDVDCRGDRGVHDRVSPLTGGDGGIVRVVGEIRVDAHDLEVGDRRDRRLARRGVVGADEDEGLEPLAVPGEQIGEVGALRQAAGDPDDRLEAGQRGVGGVGVRRLRVVDPAHPVGLRDGDHPVGARGVIARPLRDRLTGHVDAAGKAAAARALAIW